MLHVCTLTDIITQFVCLWLCCCFYCDILVDLAPVGSPQFLRTTAVTSNSMTLEWDEIVCLDQNGPITEYRVDYGVDGLPITSIVTADREITLTGLLSDESYSVRVAGSNRVGIGPFTQPLIVLTPIAGNFVSIYRHCIV